MIFLETALAGAYLVEIEPQHDSRGFFGRSWCQSEFVAHGLDARLVQCNVSFNDRKGTWRGLHYQAAPHQEAKLVRCTRGVIYDVIVDLRRESSTFRRHLAVTMSAENRRMLYVPAGIAHGFLTLEDDTEVSYQMSEFHAPEAARGVRWDDPAFDIQLPHAVVVISERDRDYPDFILESLP